MRKRGLLTENNDHYVEGFDGSTCDGIESGHALCVVSIIFVFIFRLIVKFFLEQKKISRSGYGRESRKFRLT